MVTLHYRDAADDIGRAAAILAPFDRREQWRLEMQRADTLRMQGEAFGDHDALTSAVDRYHFALSLVSETGDTLDWAQTQNDLGLTLTALGDSSGAPACCSRPSWPTKPRSPIALATSPPHVAKTQVNLGVTL